MITPVEFRRHLHRHPELSFREEQSASWIEEQLAAVGIASRRIAQTGVLARIEGRGDLRRAVVLRADIDALPIDEQVDVAWRSENHGVMHACGHDIHAAVLYGVLVELAATHDFEGTIFGLFQPGEECNPGGASLVLAEEPFADYDIRAVIGEHVEPQLEVGTLGFRAGKYMAANDELRFTVYGKGGHGALRTQIIDPIPAAAELIGLLTGLNEAECVLSIGKIEAGGATNIIPDSVYMEGTLRTFDQEEREQVKRQIVAMATQTDTKHHTHTTIDISQGYPCVVNDQALTKLAAELAAEMGIEAVQLPLRTTAEDFGHYGLCYPSLFYRLGVGTASGLTHTATFNPHEGAIGTGIAFMRSLALKKIKQ